MLSITFALITAGAYVVPYQIPPELFPSIKEFDWKPQTTVVCSSDYNHHSNCEFISGDVIGLGLVAITTIKECASVCVADSQCLYFDFTPLSMTTSSFTCLLMTSKNPQTVKAKASGIAQCGYISGRSPAISPVDAKGWISGKAKCSGNYFHADKCE